MPAVHSANREWIAAEFSKGIMAEEALEADAKATAAAPPDPSLGVLYHQIATDDHRHRLIIETIATRYGHDPSKSGGGGLSGTIHRLQGKVGEMGASPQLRVEHDLSAKASAIHWSTAWVQAFQSVGDAESARELAAVLTEQKAHHEALQEGLNRIVTRGAVGES